MLTWKYHSYVENANNTVKCFSLKYDLYPISGEIQEKGIGITSHSRHVQTKFWSDLESEGRCRLETRFQQ